MSINGHDMQNSVGSGRRRDKREAMPGFDIDDAEQREVKAREPEREKFRGDARAEERALGPGRGEATSVIRVQVCQEVSLAAVRPPVN